MTRELFDRKLNELKDNVLLLGNMVESATLDAILALQNQDLDLARRVYQGDSKINAFRFELETTCVTLIATQQPLAHDLRLLTGVLEVLTELERMGDYAKGIARICLNLEGQPLVKPLVDIPIMAKLAVDMLHRALTAFVEGDVAAARAIPKEDNQVDDLYNLIHRDLVTYMIADRSTIDQANLLLWVAHNLERLADRVTNLCERTIYIVTGVLEEMDSTDDELRI